jgi:hypothetical protein
LLGTTEEDGGGVTGRLGRGCTGELLVAGAPLLAPGDSVTEELGTAPGALAGTAEEDGGLAGRVGRVGTVELPAPAVGDPPLLTPGGTVTEDGFEPGTADGPPLC